MPSAERIIDPFAGTGTTPLALAQSGVACGFCEVNPAMQRVVDTKTRAAALRSGAGRELALQVRELADSLDDHLRKAPPATDLAESYTACFGSSHFFNQDAFEQVLRLRGLCDLVAEDDHIFGAVLTLAVLANLVRCSLLKRAGDVRYKTKRELARGVPALDDSISNQLRSYARHLRNVHGLTVRPTFLAADARLLKHLPSFEADGVITSPPYLNGTNYIRNTKLELWFLREIAAGADLRRLRDAVVTSGINDVTKATSSECNVSEVAEVVRAVSVSCYDSRIPRMVGAYFADMAEVLQGLVHHTIPGAVLCIDIGDSRYGGVHVPTQELLCAVGLQIGGLQLIDRVHLRTRIAKDRTPLSQDLLVLRRARSPARTSVRSGRDERCRLFRNEMPHRRLPYSRRNWGHPLHSACSYQGKMKPSLAHFLVHCFSDPGDVVLDPFAGAGTIPFEAALQGRSAIGMDISTMAFAVTSAKLRVPTPSALDALIDGLRGFIDEYAPDEADWESAASVRFNRPIPEYFHEETLREILAARRFFAARRDESPEWAFALTCMLHILHGNRPYALSRRSHPVTPFAPTGPKEYRPLIPRLLDKAHRGLAAKLPDQFVTGRCFQSDICQQWPLGIDQVDTIITSPPFFDSTRFYMSNWMRFWFCGWEREDFDTQPARYVETLQKKSLEVYEGVFARFRQHLRGDGKVVIHLGKSRKCDMASRLAKIASRHFAVLDRFDEAVTHCEKHGVSDKGTVKAHQYLVLG